MTPTDPWVTLVVALIVGVFGGGAFVTFLRVRVDKNQVLVTTAKDVVFVQKGLIDELQEQLDRVKAELAQVRSERDAERRELDELRRQNESMRRRLAALETQNPPPA